MKRQWTSGHLLMGAAITQLVLFLSYGKVRIIMAFFIVATIVRLFTRNLVAILGAPMLITAALYLGNATREGMETKTPPEKDATKAKPEGKMASKPTKTPAPKTMDGFSGGSAAHKDVDYAATIEGAYDELNAILGSDGIQKLTSDTQHLMQQQMQLAEAMKSMGPMMKSLTPMVEQLKGMMGDEGMASMMKMAKRVTGNA